jgi:hypothetical protein
MVNFLWQLLALFLLVGGVGVGYLRWLYPRRHTLAPSQQGLLFLVILTLMGGFIGAPFWWLDHPLSFSWDLPPLAARMLAAAGWAFALACFLALQRPTQHRLRLVLLMLFVYLVPLAVAILLYHRDRFDWMAPITYAFFAIVVLMIWTTTWYLVRFPPVIVAEQPTPLTPMTQFWLAISALVTGLWGVALFLTDAGPSALIWVWPGDLLTSRLIAVMLLTLAVAAFYTLWAPATSAMTLATNSLYGIGVVLANGWNLLAAKPLKPLYLFLFGLLAFVSLGLLVQQKRHQPPTSHLGQPRNR